MIIQKKLSKMAVFSYLIVDDETNTCAVVDPAFDTDQILSEINDNRWQLTHVINTHSHADHSAGNWAIMSKTMAKLLIHKADAKSLHFLMNRIFTLILGGKKSPKPDQMLTHGDIINIGNTPVTVIHTPGHSPGSICLYTTGNLITGDTLFVGNIGRTDLRGGVHHELISSIHKNLYTLPPETVVWPGHDYGITPSSTIQREIQTNPMT
ncbi:Beta-lactamase-like domain protein [Candidatus Magnetomorum sp. HK-1]|nr:Beta-lactamase-like domain protein [Candidatus Magnetomorum sp. HK-1]